MKDIMGLMQQAKAMQEKMQGLQQDIAGITADGRSGGGLVTLTMNGRQEMTALRIDPSLLNPDERDILEDLILAAHGDARGKIEALIAEKTEAITAGLPLPPGMKFPF